MFRKLVNEKRGILLGLIAALISGVAVFLNKEGLLIIRDSDVYTTLKNIGATVFILSFFILTVRFSEFKKLDLKNWLFLVIIGLVGGCIPFLLFFHGLSMAQNSAVPNLIHKTLFVWASVMAVIFLKEKIGPIQISALVLLLLGNILILGVPHHFQFGQAEILILMATLIWALENIFAKILLKRLNSEVVVFGRMFFGSIFLILYLVFSHKIKLITYVSIEGWIWVSIVSAILFGYAVFWYAALKYLPVSIATSILVLASPVTSLLESFFRTHQYLPEQVLGIIVIAVVLTWYIIVVRKVKWKKPLRATLPV